MIGKFTESSGRNSAGALEITDANDYYPFGMNHLKTGNAYFAQGSYKSNKYNGKELQETGMYSYGWREYMPDIGRWNGIDQLAENYLSASPYAYVLNNPINMFDPDGRVSQAWLAEAPEWLRDSWTNTPAGSNSYWYNNGNGGFTSYDGGDKGGHAGGGTLAYGSTVGYGGGFTMGDGTYTLPPLVLSAPKSYNGNAALTGLTLSFGIQKHLSTYLGMQVEGFDPMAGVRSDRGIMMIGGHGDILGLYDIGAQVMSTWEPENRYLAMGVGIIGAVALKKPGLAKVDAYAGVKEASLYLQSAGVPRAYRKQILESFEIETISLKTAGKSTYGLRFYVGAAKESGRYLFPTFDSYINRTGLALPPSWNSMTGFKQFQVMPGSKYIFGRAASQGGIYTGGSYQMYINDLSNLIK